MRDSFRGPLIYRSPGADGKSGSISRLGGIDSPVGHDLFGFLALYLLLAVVMAWSYLTGELGLAFADVGIDLLAQFYPLNLEQARQLSTGEGITWTFRLGLGGYVGTHFDPFAWLQALFPESWQLGLRIYTYLVKLGLAGLVMVLYLRLIGVRGWPAVMGGLAYAFSDYALINGQWDLHGTELLHFVLLAWLLERYLRSGHLGLALSIGLLLGISHPFNLFTSAFFTALYVIARAAVLNDWQRWRRHLVATIGLAVAVIVGILILAPLNFPGLFYFLESPRVSGSHANLAHVLGSLFRFNDLGTIKASLLGFIGKNSMGVGSAYVGWANWLEGPGFYVGLPSLLLATQLASRRSTAAGQRLFWIAAIGIGLYVLIPGFRYAVYGFNHVVFRTSTLWISMLLVVMGAMGLRQALNTGLDRFVLGLSLILLALFALVVVSIPGVALNVQYIIGVLAVLIAYSVILPGIGVGGAPKALPALLAVFVVELLLLARPSLVDRMAVRRSAPILVAGYADGSHEAAQWIAARHGETDFYRIEKDYLSEFLLDSIVQDYRGIRSYFFHGSALTRFIDKIEWPRRTPHSNYIDADTSRDDMLDLLGIKYVLAKSRERDDDPNSVHLASIGEIEIYERVNAHSPARLHSSVTAEQQVSDLDARSRDRAMLESVLVKDLEPVQAVLADEVAGPPLDVDLSRHGDTHLRGRYKADGPRLLALAMPYDRGWRLTINGNAGVVPLFPVNYGLAGAVVPAGEHGFELHYRPPGRVLGYWVAPFALLVAMALLRRQRRSRRAGVLDATAT